MFDISVPNFKEKSEAVVMEAQALMIWSDEDYTQAEEFAVGCRTMIKAIKDKHTELKRPIIDQGRAIDAEAKELALPFEKALNIAQQTILAYRKEQEQKRIEAERKAREEALAERMRLQAEANKLRAEAEKETDHDARILAQAEAIKVEESINQVSATVEIVHTPKASAAAIVKRQFECNVVSPMDFLKYIVANCEQQPALLNFIKFETAKMNKFVNATQGSIKFDGVEFVITEKVSTRAKRAQKNVIEG